MRAGIVEGSEGLPELMPLRRAHIAQFFVVDQATHLQLPSGRMAFPVICARIA